MKKQSLTLVNILIFFTLNLSISFSSEPKIINGLLGQVEVIDGDTIKINNKKIRLYGIDAPEINQECKNNFGESYKCGLLSKTILEKILSKSLVSCHYNNFDRYKRILGTCYVTQILGNFTENGIVKHLIEENLDINTTMVRFGYAVAYKKYSKKYIEDENYAKFNNKGLWSGKFDMPWEWRKKNK